jgi:hypothetical protein
MKKNLFILLLSMTVLTNVPVSKSKAGLANTETLISQQEAPNLPCSVNDPTGTPLNVRSKPNCKIIARLENGTIVEQTDTPIQDKWEEIKFKVGNKTVRGWVFKDYLACQ